MDGWWHWWDSRWPSGRAVNSAPNRHHGLLRCHLPAMHRRITSLGCSCYSCCKSGGLTSCQGRIFQGRSHNKVASRLLLFLAQRVLGTEDGRMGPRGGSADLPEMASRSSPRPIGSAAAAGVHRDEAHGAVPREGGDEAPGGTETSPTVTTMTVQRSRNATSSPVPACQGKQDRQEVGSFNVSRPEAPGPTMSNPAAGPSSKKGLSPRAQ